MRKKRSLLLFFMLLLLFMVFGIVYAMQDYSQIKPSNLLNYTGYYNYGEKLSTLKGDLTLSGLNGIDSRQPFLSRWKAIFTENIKTGASYKLDTYDVYNIMESQTTDNFYQREGYPLLPKNNPLILPQNDPEANGVTIKAFLSAYVGADQKQQDYIWNKVKDYNDFDAYGYYLLDKKPYYAIPQLVALAGGKWDHNQDPSDDLSDMSQIKGTSIFYLSPPPEITSANIENGQLQMDFSAYGYSKRDVQITVKGDSGSKTYTYYDVTDTTFRQVFSKDVSDFISTTGSNLKVIVDDGFGRQAEAPIKDAANLSVSNIFYSPANIKPFDQISTSVLATNQSNQTQTTTLIERVDGNEIGRKNITLNPNESLRVDGFPFQAPFDSQVTVSFEINPDHNAPSNESTLTDNYVTYDIPIDNTRNLYIHFRDVPESVQWNDMIPVKVAVGNRSDQPITTTVVISDKYKTSSSECILTDPDTDRCLKWKWTTNDQQVADTRTVTIPAQNEIAFTVNMPAGWDYFAQGTNQEVATIKAEVNPSKNQPTDEVTYLDNTATTDVKVNPMGVPKTKVRLYE